MEMRVSSEVHSSNVCQMKKMMLLRDRNVQCDVMDGRKELPRCSKISTPGPEAIAGITYWLSGRQGWAGPAG